MELRLIQLCYKRERENDALKRKLDRVMKQLSNVFGLIREIIDGHDEPLIKRVQKL